MSDIVEEKLSKLELQALDTYGIIMKSELSSNKDKQQAADAVMEIRGRKGVKGQGSGPPVQINFNMEALDTLREGMRGLSQAMEVEGAESHILKD